ncbi:MAG: VWA domain-containing protein [Verrucomicrobia bacterium]|nr:VWA domain-containing protein [Verrucomicrobiota bacterium]
MNTKFRFSDEETAPERGVDGLLDELGRYRAGDDIAFLGELERKLDTIDQAATEAKQVKRSWWMTSAAKIAALLAITGTAVYSLWEPLGLTPPSFLDFRLTKNDYATTTTYEAAPDWRSENSEMSTVKDNSASTALAEETRSVSETWAPPSVTVTMLPTGDSTSAGLGLLRGGGDEARRLVASGAAHELSDNLKADSYRIDAESAGWSGQADADKSLLIVPTDVPGSELLSSEMSPKVTLATASAVSTAPATSDEWQIAGLTAADSRFLEAPHKDEQAIDAAAFIKSSAGSQIRYPALVDNPFRTPAKDPLSTFSIDVDTASYSNVRRMIQSGEAVPPDAVRIEELINYFNYDYAAPGDELPFSVNLESAACPWKPEHRLVRVGLKGSEIQADTRQALNLVFLVDVSGSMNQERKLPLVQRSLHLLIDELREDDRVTIVTYAGHEGVALAPTSGTNKAAMHGAVDHLQSSGGTNGEAGIKLAYRLASENFSEGGVNRILLATDGDFNIGVSSTTALRDMVQQEAKRGVFISVLGFGSDNLNDAMLETITNDGNGTYHYIDSVSEGRRVLVEDLTGTMITIAKDVKIQVEFNPATVGAYRLVGYANRMLPPEAFNDDRVDAGDIGAGHTVTAFYEIIPPGLAVPEVDNLKYQVPVPVTPEPRPISTTGSPELFTVKLRYKAPRGTVSELIQVPFTDNAQPFASASSDFRFAASVAAFGLQLRQSPFRGSLSRDQVIAMAKASMGSDPRRIEFAELVANAIVLREN